MTLRIMNTIICIYIITLISLLNVSHAFTTTISSTIYSDNLSSPFLVNKKLRRDNNSYSILKASRTSSSSSSASTSLQRPKSVTSSLISNLAVLALKLRLSSHSSVSCDVSASTSNILIHQHIGPVTVKGRSWVSPAGLLSCRFIDATVDTCKLDLNSVLSRQKLVLLEPAIGRAMIALNANDFGNFITHPLLTKQVPHVHITYHDTGIEIESQSQKKKEVFQFLNDKVEIQYNQSEIGFGSIIFYGTCINHKWKCVLSKKEDTDGKKRAWVQVSHHDILTSSSSSPLLPPHQIQELETHLSTILTKFFNELVFEMDGTFLSFQDLMVKSPSTKVKNDEALVMMALRIKVKKFPSPGLEF